MIRGGGVKPDCEHFKPTPLSEWLCYWWEAAQQRTELNIFVPGRIGKNGFAEPMDREIGRR
jgi:hypothetical protein